MILYKFVYIRKINSSSNKKSKETNKYNKFFMENIEVRAKNQLLNIQDTDLDFHYESFVPNILTLKQKPQVKEAARILTSLSSHRGTPVFDKQNNKEFLKDKLRKLMEKDTVSPKSELKRVKTVGSLQSSNNFDKSTSLFKFVPNDLIPHSKGLLKCEVLCSKRENISHSQKTLTYSELRQKNQVSSFKQESQQIRKIIKKKIEQKASQKQKRNFVTSIAAEGLHKIQNIIRQKTKKLQLAQQNSVLKPRQKNKQTLGQMMLLHKFSHKKDKQNQGLSPLQTPLAKLNKYNNYEYRKLRNILF